MANYLQIFNEFYMPAVSDTLDQAVEQFNAASGNAIVLSGSTGVGDFIETSFYDLLGAPALIDIDATNSANSVEDVSQDKIRTVKLAASFPVRSFEPLQMDWLKKPSAEAIDVVSRQMASRIMQLQLNTALSGAIAAISTQVGATKDVSSSSTIDNSVLVDSDALFGDHYGALRTRVMHSGQYHKMLKDNIANSTDLFKFDSVRVVDILGKMVVVTDSPALVGIVGSPAVPTYKVLTLTEQAIVVKQGTMINSIVEKVDNQRITVNMGTNYSFELGVKGYSWTGANSPLAAAVANGSNWGLKYASIKSGAGVVTIGKQS